MYDGAKGDSTLSLYQKSESSRQSAYFNRDTSPKKLGNSDSKSLEIMLEELNDYIKHQR